MKAIYIKLGEKTIGFKLTSSQICEFEKQTGESIINYAQNVSITSVVTLLKHMRKWEEPSLSHNEACDLYDELVDNEYSIKRIFEEIIQPVFIECGLLTRSDLETAQKAMENQATLK